MRRLARVVACGLLALVASACAVDATVTVRVRPDGSGTVGLRAVADAEAVQAAEVGGGRLEDRVRLSDLPAAGWSVEPWQRRDDGSAVLVLSKPFTSVDQVPGILDEISGPSGPLRDATFTRTHSFFGTEFAARARVDLPAATTGVGDDAELVARLAAQGVDVAAIDARLLDQIRTALTVHLVVVLPDGHRTEVTPAAGEAATLDASAKVWDVPRVALVAAGGGLVVLAVVLVVWPAGRSARGRRARRRSARARGPARRPPARRPPPRTRS